jgi:NAD(P)H-dependent FMN reductase
VSTPLIAVITASTRSVRFADLVAPWVVGSLEERDDLRVLPIDLRDHPLPFYDLPKSPGVAPREYASDAQRELGGLFDSADGFLLITSEYNHGYPAALKNTLDHFSAEFHRKPVSFVGYGNVGGARAIEQLRQVANELELATLRHSLHLLPQHFKGIRDESTRAETFEELAPRLTMVVDDLVWWSNGLSAARGAS